MCCLFILDVGSKSKGLGETDCTFRSVVFCRQAWKADLGVVAV